MESTIGVEILGANVYIPTLAIQGETAFVLYSEVEMRAGNELSASPEMTMPPELDWLFSTSGELLSMISPDGEFKRLNAAWEGLLGFAAQEFSGRPVADFVHPDDRATMLSALHQIGEASGAKAVEVRFQSKSGSYKRLRWTLYATPAAELVYAVAHESRDHDSHAATRYLRLFETAKHGILIVDADTGLIEDANPYFFELTGYALADTAGHHLSMVPMLPNHLGKSILERLRNTEAIRIEDQLETNRGRSIPVELLCSTYWEESRRLIQCNIHETSERKTTEPSLRDSEERFRLLVEGVRDYAIFMLDPAGLVISWNIGAERLLGYTEAEVLGQYFEFIFTPEDKSVGAAHAEIACAAQSGTSMDDGWHIRKDGTRFYAYGVLTALRPPGGELRGFAKLMQDVTERRQTEEALRQAGKLESIGILAAGIAHDFNNLLVGIMGGISFALTSFGQDHPAYSMLELAEQSSHRAADLVRQLLAYAGKTHIVTRPLNLLAEVSEFLNILRMSLSPKIDLQLSSSATELMIKADPVQVQQVAMNLIINAGEAIGDKAGEIRITVTAANLTAAVIRENAAFANLKPGEYVKLDVSDNGSGMDPRTASKVFDPFFSTKFIGRGLGLAAVSGIVRTHKGAITVRSEPGQGSTFSVYFPAWSAPVPANRQPAKAKKILQQVATVLVVDDEPAVLISAGTALKQLGYKVLEADSGIKALEIVRAQGEEIAVIILDLLMKGMNGDQILPLIRQIHSSIPVVITSGYSELLAGERFGGLPDTEFLQKPYTPAELDEKIKSVLASQ